MTSTTRQSDTYETAYAAARAAGMSEHDARWEAAVADVRAEHAATDVTAMTDADLRTAIVNGLIPDDAYDALGMIPDEAVRAATEANMRAAAALSDAAYREQQRRRAAASAAAPRLLFDQHGRVVGSLPPVGAR